MFKKYFFVLFVLLLGVGFFSSQQASAFVKPSQALSDNVSYNVTAISANDFQDYIDVLVTGAPANTWVELWGKWEDMTSYTSVGSHMTSATGTYATAGAIQRNWDPTKTLPHTYKMDVYAKAASSTSQSNTAHYKITVNWADTKLTNNKGYANNATIPLGTSVEFTCSSSSEMYFGSTSDWSNAQLVKSDYGKTDGSGGNNGYTLKYTPNLNTAGTYKIECDNLGGSTSREVTTFTVKNATPPTGTITANPNSCTIEAGYNGCNSITLTWNTTNPVETSKVYDNNTGTGNQLYEGNTNSRSGVWVPYGGRTFYLFNNGKILDQVSVSGKCNTGIGDVWNSDQDKCMSTTCPAGFTFDPTDWSCRRSTFDIININSSPNHVGQANSITWTSTADYCNVYNSAKSAKIGTGVKSGSNWSASVSASNVLSSPGNQTYQIKCADDTDYPDSSLTADTDAHTGWQSYTASITTPTCPSGQEWNGSACVLIASTGSLSANPMSCTIAIGASTCSTQLTWNTQNPQATSAIKSSKPSANTTVTTGNSGSDVSATVYNGGRDFYLYNKGKLLDQKTVSASCASGSTWDGSKCAPNGCPTGQVADSNNYCHAPCNSGSTWDEASRVCRTMTGNLTATSCTISSGNNSCQTKLSWSTSYPIGTSAITSNTSDTGASQSTTVTTGNSGTNYLATVHSGGRNFYLYNNGTLLDQTNVTASCDTGLEADVNGLCHPPCPSNYAWNPNTKKCEFVECYGRAS